MSLSPRRRHECWARLLVIACAVSVGVSMLSANAAADIPHENYEYVSSDLGVVISLLNTSILYFEASLVSLHSEDTSGGSENLSAVNSLLNPAESVLDELADIAESYDGLNSLIPAFAALADEEALFIGMESALIDARGVLRSLSGQPSLTDDETVLALAAFNEASALMSLMNASIDSMIIPATEMTSLSVEGETPFSESDLVELIESLRDLLYNVEVELVELIEGTGDGPGISIDPFLTLWVSDTSLHLGDDLVGGGYLYFNDSFQPGREVAILGNGSAIVTTATSGFGSFGFRFSIPFNTSWLGTHEVVATSSWEYGNLTSDSVMISVTLIPTSLFISVNEPLLSPQETLEVSVTLRDVRGDVVTDAEISFTLDEQVDDVSVDSQGRYTTTRSAADLGIGFHTLSSSYEGEMPYASCDSPVITIKIDIPTSLELSLYSDKVYLGYYIVGEGVLTAETPDTLDGMPITLSIDGFVVMNVTTDEQGGFAFSIPTESITVGDHVLKAEFSHEDIMWRHAEDEASFDVYTTKHTAKYPFWPFIPGWGNLGAPPEFAFNLFFGDYAYFGWLLIVGIIAVVVKTVRMRKETLARKARFGAASPDHGLDGLVYPGSTAGSRSAPDLFDTMEPPDAPNERIVWSYNYFLRYLVKSRRVQIGASMTHREIARMLEAFGYPTNLVSKVTNLFEMARYSGTPMTESEMNAMGSVVEKLKSTVLGGRGYAA